MLKKEYCTLMQDLLGKDYEAYITSLQQDQQKAVICNTQKTTKEIVENCIVDLESMPYGNANYYNQSGEKLGNTPIHMAGGIYCSEPSSMMVVSALSHLDLEGATVLDLCASPGGKSIASALAIGKEGLLVSNEIVPARAKVLMSNIERMGFCNVIVTSTDGATFAKTAPHCFDLVLVDAPCSGEGMFRKDEQAQNLWSIEEVRSNAKKQLGILEDVCNTVKSGGYLVYSTCTFNQEEDDGVVAQFLDSHPDFEMVDIAEDCQQYLVKSEYGYRFLPHIARGEGQFLCLMRYKGVGEGLFAMGRTKFYKEYTIAEKFLKDYFDMPGKLHYALVGNKVCIMDRPMLETKSWNALTNGVIVGEVIKGRLEPHHQLFSSYGKYMKIQYEVDDIEVSKYLKGEELLADLPNGYGCVLYKGMPLGGVKVVGGVLKNKYPKGLRI